jgi:capsular polysaccharide export protein
MKIAIFAARKTHLSYAKTLSTYMKKETKTDLLVLWHKSILKFIFMLNVSKVISSAELDQVVLDYYRTINNEPQHISDSKFKPVSFIKKIEARLLFKAYLNGFHFKEITHLLIWNGLKFNQRIAVLAAKKAGIQCLFIERGAFPGTTTLDNNGINYINSVPRDPIFYENYTSTCLSPKINIDDPRPKELPNNYLFVPLQVNTDSQIILFSPWLKDMFALISALEEIAKEENIPTIIIKPHPSCPQDYSEVERQIKSRTQKIIFERDIDTQILISNSDVVATVNSSVGMEALLMRKKVIVMGNAFYDIKGITCSAKNITELKDEIIKSKTWNPDYNLLDVFLSYLLGEYIITGSWHKPNSIHLEHMSKRILDNIK